MALNPLLHTPLINVFRGMFQLVWNDLAITQIINDYNISTLDSDEYFYFVVRLNNLNNSSLTTIGQLNNRCKNQFNFMYNITYGVYNVYQIDIVVYKGGILNTYTNIIPPNNGANLTISSPSMNLHDPSQMIGIPY